MDVYGSEPADECGEYFRNNVWWWHPLAAYVTETAPDISCRCEDWHSNDGDGLDRDDALALADLLQAEIDSGRTASFAARHAGSVARYGCQFSVENVQEFVTFLRGSGGFVIW
jgi:hypothetical protein